jgi:hypothetical protein
MTTLQSGPRRVTVDKKAGRLSSHEAERAIVAVIAVLAGLFVLTLVGLVPTLPSSAGSSQLQGPAVTIAPTDGLPADLRVGREYEGMVRITLPVHWYDGTKAQLSPGTEVGVSVDPEIIGSSTDRVIINTAGFSPSQGRMLTVPVRLRFAGRGRFTVIVSVNLRGRSTARVHDKAEADFSHTVS